ncbi:glutamine--fructose-6-phosphate transaminase (isomerizing) [Kingella negevensis]|uniref:glutamine--fructose-6-phosphate transaminase (isomerizing) n=1 Tax=Kingella negevensis TaxID=1522312 RepID=UPI00050A1ED8|nr:glutamine--fructose-6-phosphate transaminase (isomerizing) [Kingella negevensis]MDK4688430.1 glutamine--fructose-6-phosphate transaminase (isomerizing) [Kingella negevensis]MDK4697122.1 glutamine--fructose-6-phosphate transaminase (isomerizing) [Kingella negevensis]WII90312.1 glutamine--fructose-6-phosphate transaminase (isomerizing) [Kingella negevensis]WII93943.1 glutamine--fructose-6-phosphate transaminase (isomerizing) [Kingella negevensis]
MCGIVGAIRAHHNVVDFLTDGLKRLEYRGYDSSGIAVLSETEDKIKRVRRVGRVSFMEDAAKEKGVFGHIGIGHTRWATHGGVTEPNAHPHISGGKIAVVHNGIIENFEAERARLQGLGYEFESQTDTEVISHSVRHEYDQNGGDLFAAVQAACTRFQGAYAIAVMAQDNHENMVVARMGCPLLVAFGEDETFIASDVSAVIAFTRKITYLEDGDIALLSANGLVKLLDKSGQPAERSLKVSELSLSSLELGIYSHFMQKEIHEQPRAVADTAEVFLDGGFVPQNFGANAEQVFQDIDSIKILACGTSFYAASTSKYWLESIAKIPTDVEIASEYRYRDVIANPKQLIITISQSGETLDTMEALKYAQSLGHKHSLSICNVMESALPRASELVFYTRAGAEIGVASTKAFTTQLVALFGLAVTLGKMRGLVSDERAAELRQELRELSGSIQHALNLEPQIASWSQKFAKKDNALFLGRGIHYPIALEGSLKLKEITYIHAEAYPAGELKHGPLALVDENMPVVVIAPKDNLLDKVKANMQEVSARGGELFVFADLDSDYEGNDTNIHVIRTPRHAGVLSPIVHTIPVQLLAYHTALARGTDVDKPRNLAKSVTVE